MFIDLGSRIINTDHIITMTASADVRGERQWSITLTTGEKFMAPDQPALGELMCGTIVSAPPGLTLVEAFHPSAGDEDHSVHFTTTAVLAYRIRSPGLFPEPIGGFGEPARGAYDYAVIQPDGSCVGWERVWDSLDAFKAEQQAEADTQREPEAPTKLADGQPQTMPPADQDRYEQAKASPAASETVEQLRARILAEPIQALTPDAPWRPDRDLAEVIAAVRDAHPDLHTKGVGYRPSWGWKWGPGDQDRDRAQMTSAGSVEEFGLALRFLSHAGQRFPQAKINHQRTSYSWKHAAERVMGDYISNGMLVAAAYALGFKVAANPASPNPCINLDERAALLDPDRGL